MREAVGSSQHLDVSVIIPTYNREAYIVDAVQSVLSQTGVTFEVIVVDDGSKDNTAQRLQSLDDSRLQYYYQENTGRSFARNFAIMRARGRYIAFLDSDDLYLPGKLSAQVSLLDAQQDVGMVYTSAYCINADGERLPDQYEASLSGDLYESIAYFVPLTITLPTVMVRRELFGVAGLFDEKMDRFEDTDMWRRLSRVTKILAMSEFTCLLRTHEGNHFYAQDPRDIIKALNYYIAKVSKERKLSSLFRHSAGISRLCDYYGCAFLGVPSWRSYALKLRLCAFVHNPGLFLTRLYFKVGRLLCALSKNTVNFFR